MKIPKLRLGVKAAVLIPVLYFLPLWAAGIVTLVFYFWPIAFSVSFLGTFISFATVVGLFFSAYPSFFAAFAIAAAFYLLLGVKTVAFIHRSVIFFFLLAAIVFFSLLGFFTGIIPLLLLAFVVFLICRDALVSFTPAISPTGGRSSLLAAVSALLVAELAWAVLYLNIPVWWATIAISLVFGGAFYMIIEYLRGKLYRANAHFLATTLAIVGFVVLLLATF
ncbi:MAG: hypothetical protein WC519_01215 [Parcubacteria group bacterium]